MRQRNLPFGLWLLTACASAGPSTVHLSADGVEIAEGYLGPDVALGGREVVPQTLLIHDGHTLVTRPVEIFDGVRIQTELESRDDGVLEWGRLVSFAVGQDQVWGLRATTWKTSDTAEHQVEVLRLVDQSWVSEGDFTQREGELISVPQAEPLLFEPGTGAIRSLDGVLVQQAEAGTSWEMLFADGVVFQVQGWEDTSSGYGAAFLQQRVLGPGCEVLLAGEIVAAIATPEGMETLSQVSNVLHHERVSADCSVETLEEIYHPAQGRSGVLKAGEEGWAYWDGSEW